ncbi:MAG: MarC family protein [Nitrospirota bacterium]
MLEILKALPNTFIPLFVAIDIFAVLPIFISLTSEMPESDRRAIIRQSTITALAVSLLFVAIGEAVFKVLGITVNDFKIAGGLILLVIAILDLIRFSKDKRIPEDPIGVVPIGVPLIVGPAVLTTLIVLIDHYGIVPTLISLIVNLLIVWLSFQKAQNIIKLIGKNGIIAISKVMALLLAAIAVMMIRLGLEGILK